MIRPTFHRVDTIRITPTGDAEPQVLNPCPVDLGLAPILSTDELSLERYDLTLSLAVAPDHVDKDALTEELTPLLDLLRKTATGSRVQIETWTAIAGTELPWWKTTLPVVDQVDIGVLDVELVEAEPDGPPRFEPYARVTFLRAIVHPAEDRNFYRMQMGTDDMAPPSKVPPAGSPRSTL
ncbi:hypothetical protein [Streptomyces microflavus]|uniref:hypothetical protein n=1 Tax=Streptomyces microflavus TaxID=1919 RepID=UPI003823AA93